MHSQCLCINWIRDTTLIPWRVVELEVLEAFDGIQWLRTGEDVSRRFGVSQPTVSRYLNKVLDVFELSMERVNGEWELVGDQTHLRLEREVHQLERRLGGRPLRPDATCVDCSRLSTL